MAPFGAALKIALNGDVGRPLDRDQRTLFTKMISRRWIAGPGESETPREILPGEEWWKPPGGKTSRRHSTWPDVVETKASQGVADTPAGPDESETYVSVVDVALKARAVLKEEWLLAVDFRRARNHEEPDDPRWSLYLEEAEWVQSKPGTDPIAMQVRERRLSQVRKRLSQLGEPGDLPSLPRPRGRPATGVSLKDRLAALQDDAIRIAREYGNNPPKKTVAAELVKEPEWSQYEETTLARHLRKDWWAKTKLRS